VQPRLRDGTRFVASAHKKFADPSASVSRYTKELLKPFRLRLN
jgi:hypothetical protein